MKRVVAAVLMACMQTQSATSAEVAGIKLDDRVQVAANGPELVLNGAGVRKRVIINVYVAGLYLTEKKSSAAEVIALAGPKRVSMTMLRDLNAQQLVDALNDGIHGNNSATDVEKLKPQMNELASTMLALGEAKKSDWIALDYLPEAGTQVLVNGHAKGKPIPSADFYRALLRIWLGENPVDSNLKKAMLGLGG